MIATLTLNPSLDHTVTVKGLVVEEANRWTSSRRHPGGKGINVSRAIHEMGGSTMAYGFIGGHDGRVLEILLDQEGVRFNFTPIRDETRVNIIIDDVVKHQQTRIDAPGPRISKDELKRLKAKTLTLTLKPEFAVFSGSVPPSLPVNIYAELISEARDRGVRAFLDCDGEWLREGIKAKPYLVKPNVKEAEGLLGVRLDTEEAIIQGARRFLEMGIEIVVISRGRHGLIAATRDQVVKALNPPLQVRSSVGAGDCVVAGLALRLAEGDSLVEAVRLAAAMGAACVLTPATQLCRQRDVERLLPRVEVEELGR